MEIDRQGDQDRKVGQQPPPELLSTSLPEPPVVLAHLHETFKGVVQELLKTQRRQLFALAQANVKTTEATSEAKVLAIAKKRAVVNKQLEASLSPELLAAMEREVLTKATNEARLAAETAKNKHAALVALLQKELKTRIEETTSIPSFSKYTRACVDSALANLNFECCLIHGQASAALYQQRREQAKDIVERREQKERAEANPEVLLQQTIDARLKTLGLVKHGAKDKPKDKSKDKAKETPKNKPKDVKKEKKGKDNKDKKAKKAKKTKSIQGQSPSPVQVTIQTNSQQRFPQRSQNSSNNSGNASKKNAGGGKQGKKPSGSASHQQ
jgi:hypothetical protein